MTEGPRSSAPEVRGRIETASTGQLELAIIPAEVISGELSRDASDRNQRSSTPLSLSLSSSSG